MARARNLKPGFFTHDGIAELKPLTRLLFMGLWCIADREGRLKDRPRAIKVQTLPYDDCDVDALLAELANHRRIARYEVADERYIQIIGFTKHQNPHPKEPASELPEMPENGSTLPSHVITRPVPEKPELAGPLPDTLIPHPDTLNPLAAAAAVKNIKPTKASPRANASRSIAIILEDLADIPDQLRLAADCKYNISRGNIADEWAKFRNYHISARSKHTRIDLCWDTWCRNAARYAAGRGGGSAGPGQGGSKRHDIVASATDRALAELFGVERKGREAAAGEPADGPDPWGDGDQAAETVPVDAQASDSARVVGAGSTNGGGEDSDAGIAVPQPQ